MLSTLVGILTGPLTLSSLSLAPFTRSAQTVHEHKRKNASEQIHARGEIYEKENESGRKEIHGGEERVPFSRFLTLLEERVMRILCCGSCVPWNPSLPAFIGGAYASVAMAAGGGGRRSRGGGRLEEGGRRRRRRRRWG
jgi:hypothetical protein